MFKGILFALAACFIWGLIFVVPGFMTGFAPIEVALGRHFFYGSLSCLIFCHMRLKHSRHYSRTVWIKAIYFSLISTIGYYTFVVCAVRYASPAVCALILGISPITIAFYGNWKQKEATFKSLLIPSILILIGLVIINVPHIERAESLTSYIIGISSSFLALISWSWYVVANARFLKHHPEVPSSDWCTLIGVATIFWVIIFAVSLSIIFHGQFAIERYFTPSPQLTSFLIGSAILGLLCSWVGAFLWNRASLHLPVSLAGQLTIFETIFGVLFVYILARHMPPLLECVGIAILLVAIVYGIRQFTRKSTYNNELKPH